MTTRSYTTLIKFISDDDLPIEQEWLHVPRRGDRIAFDIVDDVDDKITKLKDFRVKEVTWKNSVPGNKQVVVEIELEEIK